MFVHCFVVQCFVSFLVSSLQSSLWGKRPGCFTLSSWCRVIDCFYSVARPRGGVG